MKKEIEEELKAKGYAIVNEDGKAYLHITKELNMALQENKELGDQMVELIEQNNVCKIILH